MSLFFPLVVCLLVWLREDKSNQPCISYSTSKCYGKMAGISTREVAFPVLLSYQLTTGIPCMHTQKLLSLLFISTIRKISLLGLFVLSKILHPLTSVRFCEEYHWNIHCRWKWNEVSDEDIESNDKFKS